MVRAALVVVAAFVASACVTGAPPRSPALSTYQKPELRTRMGRMVDHVRTVEEILLSSRNLTPGDHDAIAAHLQKLAAEVEALDGTDLSVRHQALLPRLPELRRTVAVALAGAQSEPPNYYAIGLFTGQCQSCHGDPL